MKQHLHIITLGVRDFGASKKFYAETLGWSASGSQDDIAFFQAGGAVLAIYPREKLAEDALISPQGSGFSGITLAHNVGSESEVDQIIRDLKSEDVKISKKPQKVLGADLVLILQTLMIIDGKWRTIRFPYSTKMGIYSWISFYFSVLTQFHRNVSARQSHVQYPHLHAGKN